MNLEDLRLSLAQQPNARSVLETIWGCPENIQMRAVVCLWQWWKQRNEVREGGKARDPIDLAYIIDNQGEEFLKLNWKEGKLKERRMAKWRKPTSDVLSINSDGAFHSSTKQGGWGYVIRDHHGRVVQAGAGGADNMMDAFHCEIIACAAAVGAASERGIMKVEFEIDSLLLKSTLQENSFNLSVMGGVILEIKNVISRRFISFLVNYCPRECNK